MKCPFPGMDPFLERYWLDVHGSLTIEARNQLNRKLPSGLVARSGVRMLVEATDHSRDIYPDTVVLERSEPESSGWEGGGSAAVATVAQPIIVRFTNEPIPQRYVEILDASSGHRVVTSIEFISPSNKLRGPGLYAYLQKRAECYAAGVNLVEIDLTRASDRRHVMPSELSHLCQQATYQAWTWRATRSLQYEYYPLNLRDRLPLLAIPLRPTDADVALELQELVDLAYSNGGYGPEIYADSLDPPPPKGDSEWVAQLVRATVGGHSSSTTS